MTASAPRVIQMQICDLEIMVSVYKSSMTIMSNFRFSLKKIATEDNYHNTKWNQSQCYVSVMLFILPKKQHN